MYFLFTLTKNVRLVYIGEEKEYHFDNFNILKVHKIR